MTTASDHQTLGDIVAADYRAAEIFARHGLDFCCGGKQSIVDACRGTDVDPAAVLAALAELPPADASPEEDYAAWEADRLADHIVDRHHAYVKAALPRLEGWLERLIAAHGSRHPELTAIAAHVSDLTQEMTSHMAKEEHVLFPYIRAQAVAAREGGPSPSNVFGTVQNPIRMMELEHERAGDELVALRELSHGYRVPADGCRTYAVCYQELAAFERDLHLHIHLENNILFPKALELERGGDGLDQAKAACAALDGR